MQWKAKDFEARKEDVIDYFTKKEVTESSISEYCSLAGIPIVVVCEFIKEKLPKYTDLANKKIAEINEFYGVKTEEKKCPWCKEPCPNKECSWKGED